MRLITTTILGLLAALPLLAQAARITGVTPQGEVAVVRQVVLRFDQAVAPLGNAKQPAPATIACTGPVPAGEGRWTNEREWVHDFRSALPPGVRCTVQAGGALTLEGSTKFSFSTGGPAVERALPYDGATVDEDVHFLLRLNGPATPASVKANAWCEVEGIGERIAVKLVEGALRDQVLAARRVPAADAARTLLLACERPLPADTKLRLVWGAGIAAAADPAVVTSKPQRFRYQVRPRFTAEFSCEREKAEAPCMPLSPLVLRFSAGVPRAALDGIRLLDAQGKESKPKLESSGDELTEARFMPHLPENAKLRITLPKDLKDATGRPLSNAASFPLALATGAMPPIAKFAAAPFGIIEWEPEAMLPVTLRHVQPDLRAGAVRIKTVAPDQAMAWMGRLAKLQQDEFKTRETSLLTSEKDARKMDLPQLQGGDPRPFEVVGIPLAAPGYHVVEIESRLLGERLLAKPAPMYVRTGVLVTNLGVHFKRGRENALVWVTTLDRARPVAEADVAVHDCLGKPLWQGRTDANGVARVPLALPEVDYDASCTWQRGHYVTAAKTINGQRDWAFVFSNWNKGIEPWRFNLPDGRDDSAMRLHTVLDRMLLRAGETVSMKHLVRATSGAGLKDADRAQLPSQMKIVHIGSGDEVTQPIAFDAAGRAALAQWSIPATAKLGLYEVHLLTGKGDATTGRFRVEEFRVPLVDARLQPPKGDAVAPTELALALQLTHLSGGGMARAAVRATALLRDSYGSPPAGYETFSFQPPREPNQRESGDDEGSDNAKVVVDKQPATTDANGAATIVLKGLPKITRPSELQAEVSFSDPNGEVQTVTTRVPLWPAARQVGIRTGAWVAAQGKVKFQALLLDLRGKPVYDSPVSVQARSTQWTATRKRLVGGFYAYDQQTRQKDLGTVCEGRTDARGFLLCEAAIAANGEIELVARAVDEAGRASEATTSLWITQQGELWFEQDNDDRIDVLAEKPQYAPGEVARLQVRMPYRQATALVSIEREGVIDTRVVTLQGSDPVIELPIPTARPGGGPSPSGGGGQATSWAPNVFASVLVLRGRVRHVPWYSLFTWGWREPGEWWRAFRFEGKDYQAPTAMVDLAKPSHKFGVAQLRIGLDAHKLDVKVTTDAAQYAVRQTVKAKVQVTQAGKPAAGAEIAFAAVDEGLLALMNNSSWNVLDAMYQPRGWSVETASAASEIIGRRHYGRKAVPSGGGGGRNPTRELFDTLLLWRGTVALDANGEASIDVPLNDSLTSFRLVAIATADADRFGTGQATVRVTQDLQMLPGLPPLAREGDRFDAVFTLRNTTAREMKVEATLAATAVRDDGAVLVRAPIAFAPQTLTIAAGAAAEARWSVDVPAGLISIAYEAGAAQAGGAARDKVKFTQFIKPAVPLKVQQATLVQLDGTVAIPVAPPADALPAEGIKTGGLQIGLQPSLAGALPGIRRFFETYPFNCLEQQTSRALALKDDKDWQRIGNALPGYLDADGLAQYYPVREGDRANGSDRLTAYVIAAAHEANQPLPDASRERMLQALSAFVDGRLAREAWSPATASGLNGDVRKLAAIEALSRHGRASARQLQTITIAPNRWPTAAVIDWLRILKRVDTLPERAARIQEAQTILRSRLSYAGTTLTFSTEDSDNWWWLMDNGDANAARLILALADDPAWKDELPRIVTGALARQQRAAWRTTTANLWGVLALDKFAARFESQPVSGRSSATLGTASASLDWQARKAGGRLPLLPWTAQPSSLNVTQQGSGKPWLSVQALAAVPLLKPFAAGYRITRSVTPVERKADGAWTRGDVLRIKLEIEADSDRTWVALNDPVPTGATLLGSGLGRDSAAATQGEKRSGSAWLAYEERAQDAYRATWEFMPRGKHTIEYTLRLNNAGRFALPPSRVEAMYAPETYGEVPNATLEVKP